MVSKLLHLTSKLLGQLRTAKLGNLDLTGLSVVSLSSVIVTVCLLGVRHVGWLQSLELKVFDQAVRSRPKAKADSRLLIVAVTENDIKRYNLPLSDQIIAQALKTLQAQQPTVIGLDIYRDIPQPPGSDELATQLQQPNIIAITKLGTPEDPEGISAPKAIAPSQVGFNDVVTDPDGIVRRNFMVGAVGDEQTVNSFALQLAIAHFSQQNILPTPTAEDPFRIQWGKSEFTPLAKHSGGYQNIDAAGYQILFNYRTFRPAAPRISLSELLDGRFQPDMIKGKIVLIGSTAISSKDVFFTPYSAIEKENPKLFGVEIHAQMVSQFLDAVSGEGDLFWFWPEWLEVVWIVGWVFVGGTVAWQLRHPAILGMGSLAIIGAISGIGFGLFMQAGWVPIATPMVGALLTGSVVVTYRAQQAQRQQQMVMTLLGQNTSPEIAQALWQSRDRLLKSGMLPGQNMIATMLFTDIKDFSTISEQMTPEELLVWLNDYLSAMAQEIQAYGGIVNKFMGDGIMAVFGVPVIREKPEEIADDARRAIHAAIAMGKRLQLLNQEWQQQSLPFIRMRAGIYTGHVVAGSVGGRERMEYGVIGDSVNIASRLESCHKDRQQDDCRILIAQETLAYVKDSFEVEPWGPLALKGKHQLVEVYRVIGVSEDKSVPDGQPPPAKTQEQFHSKLDIKAKTQI